MGNTGSSSVSTRAVVTSSSTVERLLQLLTAIAQSGGKALTAKQLCEVVGIPSSTAYRQLAMLMRWGFVAEGAQTGTYEPGPMSLQLAWGGQTSRLVAVSHDELQQLVASTGESAGLMVTINAQVACLDMVDSPQSLRCSFNKGSMLPMLRGASAKAQLAFLPPSERNDILGRYSDASDLAQRPALERELKAIRETGYAASEGEVDWGVWGVSVPILSRTDRLLGAISLMAPAVRAAKRHKPLIHATVAAAGRIAGKFSLTPSSGDIS